MRLSLVCGGLALLWTVPVRTQAWAPRASTAAQATAQPNPDPADRNAHQAKAYAFLRDKKPALAIPEFAAIVAVDPQNLDAQANLGVLEFFAGQPQQAEPHLRAALALDPSLSKLQALLGSCEHRDGDLNSARKDLSAALPHLQDAKVRRQSGLELVEVDTALGDLPAAALAVSQLKASLPTDPEVLYAAYRIYTDLGNEAMLDLSVAAPDSAQMHQAMAHELIRERDNAAAITNLRAAIQVNPNLPGAHYELAQALHLSANPAEKAQSEAEYKLALAQSPHDEKALAGLGDLSSEKGDHAAAIAFYKQALTLQPGDPDPALGLAHELVETGQLEAALPLLEDVVKTDPTDILAHFRLSALYRRLHRPDDARREVAAYEHLKAMQDKLREIYKTMRLSAPQAAGADQ